MKTTRSLAFVVSVWTAVAIAVSMAVYAVIEYLSSPGISVSELLLTHLWHVVALAVIIYALCWALLQQILLRPITKIYLHLYAAHKGKVQPLELSTRVTELASIVEGINLLLQTQRGSKDTPFEQVRQQLLDLRQLALKLPPATQDIGLQLLSHIADLEQALAAFSPAPNGKKQTQPISPLPSQAAGGQ